MEVDPDRSHQHELHADALRSQLGFGRTRVTGAFRLVLYPSDDLHETVLGEGHFTLYDARERHPTRSEWRLYYSVSEFRDAQSGDLMVIFRESEGVLVAIVARRGTQVETELVRLLAEGRPIDQDKFQYRDAPSLAGDDADTVLEAMVPSPLTDQDYPRSVADLIGERYPAVMPSSREMAGLASEAVARTHGPLGPDLAIYHGLEAETDIYFALESRLYAPQLDALHADGADLTDVIAFSMRLMQSRRSRRGQSLENHFQRLLSSERISFSAQCETEKAERPDFVFPGCAAYHDPAFPGDRLRMVACKSTARERWRQILSEADRIPVKYLLTVDTRITATTLQAMNDASLVVFMPAPIITSSYPMIAKRIGTVSELLNLVRIGA